MRWVSIVQKRGRLRPCNYWMTQALMKSSEIWIRPGLQNKRQGARLFIFQLFLNYFHGTFHSLMLCPFFYCGNLVSNWMDQRWTHAHTKTLFIFWMDMSTHAGCLMYMLTGFLVNELLILSSCSGLIKQSNNVFQLQWFSQNLMKLP